MPISPSLHSVSLPPTARFSDVVENYAKYRPHYPSNIVAFLKQECGLHSKARVADIGSGTGLLTQLLLDHQYKVFGVEPNLKMRKKSEELLSHYSNFTSIDGTAEMTTLSTHSVDCVTAATAFHWFDKEKTRVEFSRILRPDGFCVLIWNLRIVEASPLMEKYESLLNQYGTDYKEISPQKIDEKGIGKFFRPITVKVASFPNQQRLDKNGFLGRLLSVSSMIKPDHPQYEAMIQAAKDLFDEHQENGYVDFIYSTKCYYGPMKI
ncbi:Methyltransferase type 11 [Mycoavidus cysteinexigens]|uniref:Methyltransferase type 11 n=1 Tax=Mycoavidus cysteinexigens TaxID=1553431 RepID=A0A2Z6EVQ2_9BURK|nr:methyltransferase domain-containing protein [Mycoavidus cysteinexigens]BBE09527.1 Methyltransferase type 11 [Mycoavidus cysteinexigens]GAM51708.1 methyltransferase [bacterium endosymbiont of Mortierella elongata FMR23-6]GLR01349.1 methyltransferase [Mycoavidus cysteinexigens]